MWYLLSFFLQANLASVARIQEEAAGTESRRCWVETALGKCEKWLVRLQKMREVPNKDASADVGRCVEVATCSSTCPAYWLVSCCLQVCGARWGANPGQRQRLLRKAPLWVLPTYGPFHILVFGDSTTL